MLELLFWLFLIQVMFRTAVWKDWIVAYPEGMSIYRTENWKGRREIISMIRALLSEVIEVLEAVIKCSPWK